LRFWHVSLKQASRPAGLLLPFSIHYRVRFPVEIWNALHLENPATHLLKDPLW